MNWTRVRRSTVAMGLVILISGTFGCIAASQNSNDGDNPDGDIRRQIEEEFGPLTEEQVAGFEREIRAQYRQLRIHYDDYDRVRTAQQRNAAGDHDEHRLHRKLTRRHRTLARLHEDRMWLNVDGDWDDREMAETHRAAAQWHDARYRPDGQGVEPQDDELRQLRRQLEYSMPELLPGN